MDIRAYNRTAWDHEVERGNEWTRPVDADTIAWARRGDWQIVLTPTKPVPADWFPPLDGLNVLGLAAAGGQQGAILAAAGARVTVFDLSPKQLAQDRFVAERDGLDVRTVEGDMRDLSALADASFDLVVHPASNAFVPEVRPVWAEAFRVLRPGGVLMAGFANSALYLFDDGLAEKGQLKVRNRLPYSDLTDLPEEELRAYTERNEPLWFGHTLDDQIGGQIDAGFVLTGFFEDTAPEHPLAEYMNPYIATRALKPAR